MAVLERSSVELHFEIEQFLINYQEVLNEKRYNDWHDLFVPGGIYSVTNVDNLREQGMYMVYDEGEEARKERVGLLKGYWHATPPAFFRTLANVRIVADDGAEIESKSGFLVHKTAPAGDTSFAACGYYRDHLVRVNGALRLKSHAVVLENGILPSGLMDII